MQRACVESVQIVQSVSMCKSVQDVSVQDSQKIKRDLEETKMDKKTYQRRKAELREAAQVYQNTFEKHNYSWGEIANIQSQFLRYGKRYGLIKEFRENGII